MGLIQSFYAPHCLSWFMERLADPWRCQIGSERHCYDCGDQCQKCLQLTQRICATCRGQYCIEHDSGCNSKNVSTNVLTPIHVSPETDHICCLKCAWCARGGRRIAMLDY